MSDYVVVGRGGAFRTIVEILGADRLRGYYDDEGDESDSLWLGSTAMVKPGGLAHFIAIGALRNMLRRADLIERLQHEQTQWLVAISANASVSPSAAIGNGSVLIGNCCIGSGVKIGDHALVYSGTVIEHDAQVGRNANIGPGVVIAGGASVGDNVYIGAGAILRDGVVIGNETVIGAGSLVLESIPSGVIAYGHPALPVRLNDAYSPVHA